MSGVSFNSKPSGTPVTLHVVVVPIHSKLLLEFLAQLQCPLEFGKCSFTVSDLQKKLQI